MFNDLNFQTNFRRQNSKHYFELACRKNCNFRRENSKITKKCQKSWQFFPAFFQIFTVLAGIHAANNGRRKSTCSGNDQWIDTNATANFFGVGGTLSSEGFKVQTDSTDIISTFADGISQSCGFGISWRETGILDISAILVDFLTGSLHGE